MKKLIAYTPIVILSIPFLIFSILATTYRGPESPPGFKDKVAAAKSESERMNFGDLLEEETIYQSLRRGKGMICSTGTYTSKKGSGSGIWCMQGYVKYFGVKKFGLNRIDVLHNEMLGLGWQLKISPDEYDSQKQIALTRKDRSGGFSYTNKDGLSAHLSFAQNNSNWQGCDASPMCRLSNEKSSQYQAIVSAGVNYELKPDF